MSEYFAKVQIKAELGQKQVISGRGSSWIPPASPGSLPVAVKVGDDVQKMQQEKDKGTKEELRVRHSKRELEGVQR